MRCAAIATPLSPHRRIALDDLVRIFQVEYESVLAACGVSTKAAAAALFTKE
jgi:hypothetical protein